jgi:ADP-ribose pyrophosphatase
MKFTPWKTLSSKVLLHYRIWDYMEDQVELPNGKQINYHYLQRPGSVTIIPSDDQGNLVVIREYRYLTNDVSLEFPAGLIDGQKTPLETAQSELAEEVGLQAKSFEFVARAAGPTGVMKGFQDVFIATGLTSIADHREETEQIEVLHMSPSDFEAAVRRGEVTANHILVAWALARHRLLS